MSEEYNLLLLHCLYGGLTMTAIDKSVRHGNLDFIKILHNHDHKCTTEAMDTAAFFGHLEIITFLHEHRTEGCTTEAMDNAAMNGHFGVVQWLHENRTEGCTELAFNVIASRLDYKEQLLFLYNNYKHVVPKVNEETYKKLLPFIEEDFKRTFKKIEKQNIVREFLAKQVVYHPTSSYVKRIVNSF